MPPEAWATARRSVPSLDDAGGFSTPSSLPWWRVNRSCPAPAARRAQLGGHHPTPQSTCPWTPRRREPQGEVGPALWRMAERARVEEASSEPSCSAPWLWYDRPHARGALGSYRSLAERSFTSGSGVSEMGGTTWVTRGSSPAPGRWALRSWSSIWSAPTKETLWMTFQPAPGVAHQRARLVGPTATTASTPAARRA
jgi:hypothetical protein